LGEGTRVCSLPWIFGIIVRIQEKGKVNKILITKIRNVKRVFLSLAAFLSAMEKFLCANVQQPIVQAHYRVWF
jgi:hypothetical protein